VTAPERDELAGGADRDPVRLPTWVSVVGLALAVLVGWFVVARTSGGDDPGPSAHSTSTASPGSTGSTASADEPRVAPSEPVATGYPPLEGPMRLIGDLCVQTQDPRTMIVEFEVENAGVHQVEVLSLSAHLPIGGLDPTGGKVPARSLCGRPVDPATSTVLQPGERVAVSLGFNLPPECPAPYPVQADVALAEQGSPPTTQRLHLLNDLGGYDFASCHTP
jgi:hypothetical protein